MPTPIIRQAITTRYLCPTNTRGSRYRATCAAHTITVSADDASNIDANHIAARKALCAAIDDRCQAQYGPTRERFWSERRWSVGETVSGTFVHVSRT